MTPAHHAVPSTVIVCTHNPRPHHLERTLEALRAQTLPGGRWELLIVDNASTAPVDARATASFPAPVQVIREDRLGLTHARLAGIQRARGAVLVFVDDDNVLAPDYLERAADLAEGRPELGAWGGNVRLEFECEPPRWTRRHWTLLARREVARETFLDEAGHKAIPCGAGLCVRRAVAEHYYRELQQTPWRKQLGRIGSQLMSGEDSDLALTARDLGLTVGLFPQLKLDHLIPPERVTEEYLLRLREGILLSQHLLALARNPRLPPPRPNLWQRFGHLLRRVFLVGRHRRFYLAKHRARLRAVSFYESVQRDAAAS